MSESTPTGSMNEDLVHLEENLHRLVNVARVLARDADAIEGQQWNEPYAYRAALGAIKASANLRSQLESRWLVTPLENERPEELNPTPGDKKKTRKPSYPHVITMGVQPND